MPKKIDLMANSGILSDRAFRDLWQQAIAAPDEDAFVAEANCPDADLLTTQEQLRRMWHIAHDGFRDLLEAFGLTQKECADRFCISFDVLRSWCRPDRDCPPYLRLLMAEALGYVTLRQMSQI